MIYLASLSIVLLVIGVFCSKELIEAGHFLFFCISLKCIYQSYKDKKLNLPKSSYWLLAFILVALISLWINDSIIPRASINRAKLKYPLYGVLGIYFFRYWFNNSKLETKKWVTNFIFGGVTICSAIGIFIFLADNQERLWGLIHTSRQAYGASLLISLLLTLLLYRIEFKNLINSKMAFIALVTNFVAMTLTFSRGPMFSLICAIPIALYFYKKKLGYIVGGLCILLSLAISANYFLGTKNLNTRFLVTKENHPESARRGIWKAAITAVEERPLLGLGYFNFKKHINRIKSDYALNDQYAEEYHAHNNILEIASGTGLIGLFFFLGWLISWIFESYKSKWGMKLLAPFFVVFLITGMVEVTIIDSHLSSFIYLIYSFSSSFWKDSALDT